MNIPTQAKTGLERATAHDAFPFLETTKIFFAADRSCLTAIVLRWVPLD